MSNKMVFDKSWMSKRGSADYIIGIEQFVNFVKKNTTSRSQFPCPCNRCKNSKGQIYIDEINLHLFQNGMLESYVVWKYHGENEKEFGTNLPTTNEKTDEPLGDKLNFPRLSELIENVFNVDTSEVEHANGDVEVTNKDDAGDDIVVEPGIQDGKKYMKFRDMASEPLYPGCPEGKTALSTIIELQNLKTRYGWTGTSVTALLEWLKTLFNENCKLPQNYPNMKNQIKDLGMECQTIHACRNGCILYRNRYEHLHKCPECGVSRYKLAFNNDDSAKKKKMKKEPAKFVKYFPLIPRLKRFFSIPWIVEAMTWHKQAKNDGNIMRHPCDSAQWDSVKFNWPEFDADPRNLRLAISIDGFNPHGTNSNVYSCWPVILAPLNLPPSLCLKKEFCLLTLLISGPKAPGKNIDVFMEPLVEDLKELWGNGVPTWDAFTKTTFNLKAMLFWGVHDFPAYGNLSGCTVHGYKACPVCADSIDSARIVDSSKIYYHGYRRFLNLDHKFRHDKKFNKVAELRPPPRRLSGEEVEEKVSQILASNERKRLEKFAYRKRKRQSRKHTDKGGEDVSYEDESTLATPWSRRSILFDLPYWKFLEVRHNIDVMHTEKNVTEHLLNMLMGVKKKTKDGIQGRKEMKKLGKNKKLWLVEDEETGKISLPKASYTLTKEEKQIFCQTLKDLKLPTNFSSNLSNCVSILPPELKALKSHDYLMQHLLPVLLRHSFHKDKDIRNAIQRISLFFKMLCAKVINKEELKQANKALVEAMCVLEKEFPPSFFVISVHCMVHLGDEALSCGPVRFRWMYPFERLMKLYKEYTLNKRYIEGSIAEAYLVDESVMYCMDYMPYSNIGGHKGSREDWLDESVDYTDEKAFEIGKTVILNHVQFEQVRRWVLNRLADANELSEWERKYNSYCKSFSTRNQIGGLKRNSIIKDFIPWLRAELLDAKKMETTLWRLANGPLHKATSFKKYGVNGFIFSRSSSEECLVTQDSGVAMEAYSTFVSRRKDKNPKEGKITFYGIIREILELDYIDFKETVFYCDWVKVEDSKNGCKVDPLWNQVMVNLKKFKNKERVDEDPFILAEEAIAVFYSKDQKDDGWFVVLNTPKRLTKEIDTTDIPTDYQSCLKDNPNFKNLLIFDE